MSNDNDAFACGYAYGLSLYRNEQTREDLPAGHEQAIRDRFGLSGEAQWWVGFDRAAWWMQSTT